MAAIALPFTILYIRYARLVDTELRSGPFSDTVTFYAAPTILTPGQTITPAQVIEELERGGYTNHGTVRAGSFQWRGSTLDVQAGPQSSMPALSARIVFQKDHIARISDARSGETLTQLALEPPLIANLVNSERERRRLIQYEEIPPVLIQAIVATEDKHFFEHAGFDPYRLVKAAWVDLRYGRKEQGGSTITMQLARGLWLDADKRWKRKATESLITAILEQKLSKKQILEYYCNQVYLGRRDTYSIHGFGEAARSYFGKDIRELTLPEAALLAGLIQRPSYYNPYRYPERARARRNIVFDLMLNNGFLTPAERDRAANTPVTIAKPASEASEAPYFVALTNDELQSLVAPHSEDVRGAGGLKVYTTIDLNLQRAAQEAVAAGMQQVDKLVARKYKDGVKPQVALIAIDPRSGAVKAAVGGRDYSTSQLNHLLALRQPGSVFKPFVYAAALSTAVESSPRVFTPATTVVDAPAQFRFANQTYEPGNFGERYYGSVTLRNALAHSLNIATVKVAEAVGYDRVVRVARRAGLNRAQATPAVALGSYEQSPLEIAGAYTAFANQGMWVHPTFIDQVRNGDGALVVGDHSDRHPALDARVAFLMTSMMEDVLRYGTGAAARSRGFKEPAAGKTGTSRDGWFAGFTSNLLCVVWVGFDDNRELNLEGSKSALPIWTEFMQRASRISPSRSSWNPKPAGITSANIDPVSGQLSGLFCPAVRTEFFISGTEPRDSCEPPEPEIMATGTALSPAEQPLRVQTVTGEASRQKQELQE